LRESSGTISISFASIIAAPPLDDDSSSQDVVNKAAVVLMCQRYNCLPLLLSSDFQPHQLSQQKILLDNIECYRKNM
jgi:hypothetical protein